jgi:hypothetical protein
MVHLPKRVGLNPSGPETKTSEGNKAPSEAIQADLPGTNLHDSLQKVMVMLRGYFESGNGLNLNGTESPGIVKRRTPP